MYLRLIRSVVPVALLFVSYVQAWSSSFFAGKALSAHAPINTAPWSMRTPVIEKWRLLTNGRITGTIKNHPTIPDGDIITTSPVERPDQVAPRKVVSTFSGSKYQLGEPQIPEKPSGGKIPLEELRRRARVELSLTGETVGDDSRQYLLAGKPVKSTSGKSQIYKGYRADSDGLPVGDALTIKVSNNWEAIEREAENYARITKSGFTRGKFVTLIDYFETASTTSKRLSKASVIIIERGVMDLKRYVALNGQLNGRDLRSAAAAAAQCLQAVHGSGLVWTDMKTENFIVTEAGEVKGIDLESAMPVKDNPVDYSPEATPPEFARAFLAGDGPYFMLQYNYDVWSFGMMLYELATGRGYFDGMNPMQITKALRAGPEINVDKVEDSSLRDLIKKCLALDPTKRPSILQILLHPYFLRTGIGPLSF